MDKVEEVCSLLNIQLCGKIYTNIAGYLYQQCKCQTFTAYIQNFFNSPCMEYFKCPVVQHLQDLYKSGILRLSEDGLSYVNLVASIHCYREFLTWSKNGNKIELANNIIILLLTLVTLGILLTCYFRSKTFMVFSMTTLFCALYNQNVTWDLLTAVKFYGSAHHPTLRVLEIVSKFVCHYVVNVFTIIRVYIIIILIIVLCVPLEHSRHSPTPIITVLVLLLSLSTTYAIQFILQYCCQFIPVCI